MAVILPAALRLIRSKV